MHQLNLYFDSGNYKMADVVCKICGDSSHVTADCKQGKDGEPVDEAKMDEEYLNFMAELGGPGAGGQVRIL